MINAIGNCEEKAGSQVLSRYTSNLRAIAIWKFVALAGVAALAVSLGFAYVARSAPTSYTTYACISRFTSGMRWARGPGMCSAGEFEISWNSTNGADLDDAYVNEGQPDSITSTMIVDGAVHNGDLAADSVTTDKILNGTLTSSDLSAALLTAIDAETLEGYHIESFNEPPLPSTIIATRTVTCPGAGQVVGGGASVSNVFGMQLLESYPSASTSWTVSVIGNMGDTFTTYAICLDP